MPKPPRRSKAPPPEYDFHGLTVAQVAGRLQPILARHAPSAQRVNIIHGKGDGLLAAEVLRVARADPRVVEAHRSVLNPGMTVLSLRAGNAPARPAPALRDFPEPPIRGRKR